MDATEPQGPDGSGRGEMAPGDEAPPNEDSAAENICPECDGTGEQGPEPCPNCGGSGRVVEAIGGG